MIENITLTEEKVFTMPNVVPEYMNEQDEVKLKYTLIEY